MPSRFLQSRAVGDDSIILARLFVATIEVDWMHILQPLVLTQLGLLYDLFSEYNARV